MSDFGDGHAHTLNLAVAAFGRFTPAGWSGLLAGWAPLPAGWRFGRLGGAFADRVAIWPAGWRVGPARQRLGAV